MTPLVFRSGPLPKILNSKPSRPAHDPCKEKKNYHNFLIIICIYPLLFGYTHTTNRYKKITLSQENFILRQWFQIPNFSINFDLAFQLHLDPSFEFCLEAVLDWLLEQNILVSVHCFEITHWIYIYIYIYILLISIIS